MKFVLNFTTSASATLKKLKYSCDSVKGYKAIVKTLRFLQENPRHPSLQSHKYHSIKGPEGQEVFEIYAEQDTPAAYRIFFYYGPQKGEITIFAITPHL